jgi:hypothetical protein
MATVALSGIITPTNVVTATSTTTLTNKTLTGAVMNGTLGATTPSTVVATTVKASTTMGVGGATPSASGAGITFPATQSASSDANTLDDYEEGTFTPSIVGGTTSGTGTYDYQIGTYTKIGNMVYFYCRCSWSAHTGSGTMSFAGLPFTISSDTVGSTSVYIETAVTLTALNVLQMRLTPSTTNVLFAQYATGGSNASAVAFDTSADVRISGQYRI